MKKIMIGLIAFALLFGVAGTVAHAAQNAPVNPGGASASRMSGDAPKGEPFGLTSSGFSPDVLRTRDRDRVKDSSCTYDQTRDQDQTHLRLHDRIHK